jgi:hypothetical protein
MAMPRILGVHPVPAREPLHLVAIDLSDAEAPLEWSSMTRPLPGRDSSYWSPTTNAKSQESPNAGASFFTVSI